MEGFHHLMEGFAVVFQPMYLFYCCVGVLGGTLVGVLPAIGPASAIALLLPTAYSLDPTAAIILLAGIYYGSQYGGSTTSILVNIPGEASSIVTCLDGYPMALQGRAGAALGMAAFASYIAGTLSIVGLMFFAPPLSRLALNLGPPEYCTLMVLALTTVAYVASGSALKSGMMVALGIFLSTVGSDITTTKLRFTYQLASLQDGVSLIPLVIGLFGLKEVLENLQGPSSSGEVIKTKIKGLLPTWEDWKVSIKPILRGGALGFFMGILPGISTVITSFISYGVEKKLSKHPERFGKGAIEGVAGPEAANNSGVCGAQVPLFSLGIPTNASMTMMLGALMIFGMTPGPQFIQTSPQLFWGLIASMYMGNVMLLVLNLPLIPLWVKVLKTPFILLNVIILVFCFIGAYAMNLQVGDLHVVLVFSLVGVIANRFGYEAAPLIMAFILGKNIEVALRASLVISGGSFSVFVSRPISAIFLVVAILIILSAVVGVGKKSKLLRKTEHLGLGDKLTALFGFLFALFVIEESFRIGVGSVREPGPGFLPLLAAIFLGVFSAVLLVRCLLATPEKKEEGTPEKKGNVRVLAYVFPAIIIYALIFERLGFILSTFLIVTFLLKYLEHKKWPTLLLTSGIVSVALHIAFTVFLHSELPPGILDAFF